MKKSILVLLLGLSFLISCNSDQKVLDTLNEYNFEKGNYSMLFEICMGKPLESIEEDEVYYKFTFKKEENSIFKVLKDDPYGWNKQMSL